MMKRIVVLFAVCLLAASGAALAQSQTEREIKHTILQSYKYSNENLRTNPAEYSKLGALEFWSSGGLLHEIKPTGRPEKYKVMRLQPAHIQVVVLVEGQAAVAQFYSEGALQPEGFDPVPHYMTRVTQAFVKEDGAWKVRASHWSPIIGGSGTSQTAE